MCYWTIGLKLVNTTANIYLFKFNKNLIKGNIFVFSFSEKLEKSLQEIIVLKENLKEKSEKEEKLEGLYFVSLF